MYVEFKADQSRKNEKITLSQLTTLNTSLVLLVLLPLWLERRIYSMTHTHTLFYAASSKIRWQRTSTLSISRQRDYAENAVFLEVIPKIKLTILNPSSILHSYYSIYIYIYITHLCDAFIYTYICIYKFNSIARRQSIPKMNIGESNEFNATWW